MTDPRRHRHDEPCAGYASRRDRSLPRRPDRGIPRNQRQVSGPGGVSRRTTRRGTQRRRPPTREARTTATRIVEIRGGPTVGFDHHRTVVLDAWPLLRRYAGEEPSRTAVDDLLTDTERTAVINTINFGEAVSAFLSLYGPEVADRQEWLLRNFVDVRPATEAIMVAAARIKVGWYITWGDAVAAATGLDIAAPVLTGDSELLTPTRAGAPSTCATKPVRRPNAPAASPLAAASIPRTRSRTWTAPPSPDTSSSRCAPTKPPVSPATRTSISADEQLNQPALDSHRFVMSSVVTARACRCCRVAPRTGPVPEGGTIPYGVPR